MLHSQLKRSKDSAAKFPVICGYGMEERNYRFPSLIHSGLHTKKACKPFVYWFTRLNSFRRTAGNLSLQFLFQHFVDLLPGLLVEFCVFVFESGEGVGIVEKVGGKRFVNVAVKHQGFEQGFANIGNLTGNRYCIFYVVKHLKRIYRTKAYLMIWLVMFQHLKEIFL
jgi:hypothetical protein